MATTPTQGERIDRLETTAAGLTSTVHGHGMSLKLVFAISALLATAAGTALWKAFDAARYFGALDARVTIAKEATDKLELSNKTDLERMETRCNAAIDKAEGRHKEELAKLQQRLDTARNYSAAAAAAMGQGCAGNPNYGLVVEANSKSIKLRTEVFGDVILYWIPETVAKDTGKARHPISDVKEGSWIGVCVDSNNRMNVVTLLLKSSIEPQRAAP